MNVFTELQNGSFYNPFVKAVDPSPHDAQTQVTESFRIVCVTNNSHLLYVSVNAVLCKFFSNPPSLTHKRGPGWLMVRWIS